MINTCHRLILILNTKNKKNKEINNKKKETKSKRESENTRKGMHQLSSNLSETTTTPDPITQTTLIPLIESLQNQQQVGLRNGGNWTPVSVPFCLRVQTYSINNTYTNV